MGKKDLPIFLSIVIPAYNEGEGLSRILKTSFEIVKEYPSIEIIIVDNGSIDQTPDILIHFQKQNPHSNIRNLRIENNKGYGHGILQGLKKAKGHFLGWTHADLQTDLKDIIKAYEILKSSPESPSIIKGRRLNRPILDNIFTFGMTLLSSLFFRIWLSDINAQPKVFPRELFEKFKSPPHDFSLDLYLLYQGKKFNYPIRTIPVFFKERTFGEAKGAGSFKNKGKVILRTLYLISKISRTKT